jgi:protein TonB
MAPSPRDVDLRLSDRETPVVPGRRFGRAASGSLVAHLALALLLIWGGFHAAQVVEQAPSPINVVYLPAPGPGGGGGGNPAPPAPTRLDVPRPRPFEPVPTVQPAVLPTPPPDPTLNATITTSLDDLLRSNGLGAVSLGPSGGGLGPGVGPGRGPGIGPGHDGNFGGDAARPGNGCVVPQPLGQPRPNYTADAMRAKLQGDVYVEVVVRKDGTVGDVRVTQSLDPAHGLDAEAIKAAKSWTFRAATCQGRPVDMVVTLILEFRLH